jgi:hypothetical protein
MELLVFHLRLKLNSLVFNLILFWKDVLKKIIYETSDKDKYTNFFNKIK